MTKYTIQKGEHYSTYLGIKPFGISLSNRLTFEGKFDTSCLYDISTSDVYDINKFYGISTDYSHHIQSARLGWRCLDGKNIELLTYCYDGGVRIPEVLLDTVKPNQLFKCTIIVESSGFKFLYEGNTKKEVFVKKEGSSNTLKFKLYPYFGGNLKSPHKMWMWIK